MARVETLAESLLRVEPYLLSKPLSPINPKPRKLDILDLLLGGLGGFGGVSALGFRVPDVCFRGLGCGAWRGLEFGGLGIRMRVQDTGLMQDP